MLQSGRAGLYVEMELRDCALAVDDRIVSAQLNGHALDVPQGQSAKSFSQLVAPRDLGGVAASTLKARSCRAVRSALALRDISGAFAGCTERSRR